MAAEDGEAVPLALTALVPMKGHSERIPGKNLKDLGGKPLCLWILETLEETGAVQGIVVNTDSEEIADLVTRETEAKVHWRPEDLQGDYVSMNRIIEHDLREIGEDGHYLQTHATNPFLTPLTLGRAIRFYFERLEADHDSVFSVTRHQSRFYDAEGQPINHEPGILQRTQDLTPLYEENSNFYVFSRSSFRDASHRIGARPAWFEVEPREALDIDEPWEWELAEAILTEFGP